MSNCWTVLDGRATMIAFKGSNLMVKLFEKIKKRDGTIEEFDSSKITNTIQKAGEATGEFVSISIQN